VIGERETENANQPCRESVDGHLDRTVVLHPAQDRPHFAAVVKVVAFPTETAMLPTHAWLAFSGGWVRGKAARWDGWDPNAVCWLPLCGNGINRSSIALLFTSKSILGMQERKDAPAFLP